MVVALLFALQATAQQPATRRPVAPQRPLADPGVIAVEQRVTPAGVQSVFDGKVAGVRFGKNPGELWVAVPGAAYRLAWRDNRAITSSASFKCGITRGWAKLVTSTTGKPTSDSRSTMATLTSVSTHRSKL